MVELQAKRRRGGARDSDADQLGRLTGVPAVLWVLVFVVLTVSCLFAGVEGCGFFLAELGVAKSSPVAMCPVFFQ